jgi:hypothetical protein
VRIVRRVAMAILLLSGACCAAAPQAVDCRPEALELSAGRLKQMPNVVGCQFDPVNHILRRYEPRMQKQVVAGSQPEGEIVRQSPDPGEPFQPRMLIVLTVSDGTVSNTESPPSEVPSRADLSLSGTVEPVGPYWPGETIEFSVDVTNKGQGVARNVRINQTPSNLTIQSVNGACTAFPCFIVDLDPDSSASVRIGAIIVGEGNFNVSVDTTFMQGDQNLPSNRMEFGGNAASLPSPPKIDLPPAERQNPDLQNNPVDSRGYSRSSSAVRMRWVWWLLAGSGLLGVLSVFIQKLRRARWRSKTAVRASIEKGDLTGTPGPLSIVGPQIHVRVALHGGDAAPDGRILIVREEVLDA